MLRLNLSGNFLLRLWLVNDDFRLVLSRINAVIKRWQGTHVSRIGCCSSRRWCGRCVIRSNFRFTLLALEAEATDRLSSTLRNRRFFRCNFAVDARSNN